MAWGPDVGNTLTLQVGKKYIPNVQGVGIQNHEMAISGVPDIPRKRALTKERVANI